MGNDTRALEEQFNEYLAQMEMIGEVQQLDAEMQDLALIINTTSSDLGISEGQLDVLTSGVQELKEAAPGHNKTVKDLVTRVHAYAYMYLKYNQEVLFCNERHEYWCIILLIFI